MALIDMSKPVSVPAPGAVIPTTAAPLDVATAPHPSSYISDSQMDGEFGNADVSVPYLKIGQSTSKGVADNPEIIKSFVWSEGTLLGKGPLTVVFLRISKYYQEKTKYSDQVIPKKWRTRADADASGLDYEEHGVLELLIEVPKELASSLEEQVFLTAGGVDYIAARMDVKTRGYRNTIGVLLRDKGAWLKGVFAFGKYALLTDKRTDGQNTWYVPLIKACGPTSQELRDEVKTRYGIGGL